MEKVVGVVPVDRASCQVRRRAAGKPVGEKRATAGREAAEKKAAGRPYEPRGAAEQLFYVRDREVLLVGPAGTGKTRAALEKLFLCLAKYRGMRGLLVRQTRASLSQSILVTLEDKVIPAGHPMLSGASRGYRHSYVLANGSELVLGGLDNPDRVMSSEYDMLLACEATELSLEGWEKLLTRLRNGVMPYQQAIAECNPAHPGHWLNRRAEAGLMVRLISRHQDNPQFFDAPSGLWTPAGRNYLATLECLSGVRRQRLLEGRWAAPEGLVYPSFSEHVLADAEALRRLDGPAAGAGPGGAEPAWRGFAGIDYGWVEPLAAVIGLLDAKGCLYVVREFYETRAFTADLVRWLRPITQRWRVEMCYADPSAAKLIHELRYADIPCRPARSGGVMEGIARVEARLLTGRLQISSACRQLLDEAQRYQYVPRTDGAPARPRCADDHALDALRYLVVGLALDRQADDPELLPPAEPAGPAGGNRNIELASPGPDHPPPRPCERFNSALVWGE